MLENGTKVFGDWTVESKIGSGAYGTVYKIAKEEDGVEHRSALKVITIPPENSDVLSLRSEGMTQAEISAYYSDIASTFMEETKLLEELKGNANIVGYEDHLVERSDDGMSFTIMIKMELLIPLKNLLAERPLSEEEVLKLGVDMCSALEVCEGKRIIHRDIKPDNIFVSNKGEYKLGDFGVARTLEKTVGVMSQKGTYTYMAPEVFLGKEYNQNVDLYSLGILLYQLLNKNRTPFLPEAPKPIKFTDREEAQKKRMSGQLLPWIKGLPDSWNGLLVKMCHPNPAYRFQNATEVKEQINNILAMGREYSMAKSVKPIVTGNVHENTVSFVAHNTPSAKPKVPNNNYPPVNKPAQTPSANKPTNSYANQSNTYSGVLEDEKTASIFAGSGKVQQGRPVNNTYNRPVNNQYKPQVNNGYNGAYNKPVNSANNSYNNSYRQPANSAYNNNSYNNANNNRPAPNNNGTGYYGAANTQKHSYENKTPANSGSAPYTGGYGQGAGNKPANAQKPATGNYGQGNGANTGTYYGSAQSNGQIPVSNNTIITKPKKKKSGATAAIVVAVVLFLLYMIGVMAEGAYDPNAAVNEPAVIESADYNADYTDTIEYAE